MIRTISVSNIVTANGNAPVNISNREILGSLIVLFITKHDIPKGGVKSPISAPTTVTIPNQTRSIPKASSAVKNKGTIIKIIEAVSRIVPNNKSKITYSVII